MAELSSYLKKILFTCNRLLAFFLVIINSDCSLNVIMK